MSPSYARLVVWVGFVLALGGPGVGGGESLLVPGYQSIGQQVSLIALALKKSEEVFAHILNHYCLLT